MKETHTRFVHVACRSLVVALALTVSVGAQAAVLETADTPAGNRNDFGGTVGTAFVVDDNVVIDSLGFEDAGADGLTQAHMVGIWDSGGTLLGSVTVAAGTGAPQDDAWRYAELSSPIVLLAGQTYRVGGQVFSGGDAWTDTAGGASDFAYSVGISDTNPTNVFVGGGFAAPGSDGTLVDLRWAPANAAFREPSVLGSDGSQAGNRNNFTGNVGTRFVVGDSDRTINALGFEDPEGDGLGQAHMVGLWDSGGSLLASVTVPAGSGAALIDGWRYVELGFDVTLSAGQTYTLGAEVFAAGDLWTDASEAGGSLDDLGLSAGLFLDPRPVFAGGAFARPVTDGSGNGVRWAPANATYIAAVIPAPVALPVGLLMLGALATRRRTRS